MPDCYFFFLLYTSRNLYSAAFVPWQQSQWGRCSLTRYLQSWLQITSSFYCALVVYQTLCEVLHIYYQGQSPKESDRLRNVIWVTYACMRACSVAHSSPILCNPMDCSLPASSVCEISQARTLYRLPCPPPGDLPNPGIKPVSLYFSYIGSQILYHRTTWEAPQGHTESSKWYS